MFCTTKKKSDRSKWVPWKNAKYKNRKLVVRSISVWYFKLTEMMSICWSLYQDESGMESLMELDGREGTKRLWPSQKSQTLQFFKGKPGKADGWHTCASFTALWQGTGSKGQLKGTWERVDGGRDGRRVLMGLSGSGEPGKGKSLEM